MEKVIISHHRIKKSTGGGPANRSQVCFINTSCTHTHILSCFLCCAAKIIEFRQSSAVSCQNWRCQRWRRRGLQNLEKYASPVWISASKSGHTAPGRRSGDAPPTLFKLKFNKKKTNKNLTHTKTLTYTHLLFVNKHQNKTKKCAACVCKCLHPVMWGAICVCAMPKWVWNGNNNKNKMNPTTTPLVLSKQTPQTRLLLLFVVVVMSHTFVTWSNGDRSRRWEIAVSVVLAEVATLADSSVVEVWQPRTRTPTHVRTRAIPKMGVWKVLFLSQCCKSIGVILSHTHIWRDEYFFFFYFCCY